MAHTYEISTDRGKVRLLMADTRAESAIFTDAEIDNALSEGGSVDEAVNYLYRVLISGHAAKGDTARADALRQALAARGGTTLPTVDVDFPDLLPMDSAYTE